MLAYLKEILYLMGVAQRKIPFLLLLFLLTSAFDVIGLGLIGPYLSIIVDPERFLESSIGQFIIGLGFPSEPQKLLVTISVGLVLIFLLKAVAAILINWLIMRFAMNQKIRLQKSLMKSYQHLPYLKYLERNSSEYIQTIHDKASFFAHGVLVSLLNLFSAGIITSVIVVFLAYTNFFVLTILLFLLLTIAILYDQFFRKRVKKYGELSNIGEENLIQGINEGIEGLKEIRILGRANHFLNKVEAGATQSAINTVKANIISAAPPIILEFSLIAFVTGSVLVAIMLGVDSKEIIPLVTVFGVASLRLKPLVGSIINGITQLRFCRFATSIVYRDLKRYRKLDTTLPTSFSSNGNIRESFNNLELKDISFRYPNTNNRAIENLTISINAGESVGIIGPSGAGKTTLIDLLLGLLEPQQGKILYNGKLLNNSLHEWQLKVAYLPQEIFLIDNTVRANIALGLDDHLIDDQKIAGALRQARLSALVDSLPNGINTIIGERGSRLSGGQRQRVALARAFYHGRSVLVMDEATSSLDHETEQEIVDEIKRLKGQKTLIVIAHRLSTIEHCDRVYRLESGRIVKQGSYADVVQS